MTVTRKIIQIKKEVKLEDIEPPKGLNFLVLDYDNRIIEVWASDHPALKSDERVDSVKFDELIKELAPVKILDSHPKSPPIIGQIVRFNPDTGESEVLDEG